MPDLPFTLHQLRTFATVVRLGSVTGAAVPLHISQPAVSHAIHELERRLGVPLFERVRNRMVVTADGEVLNRMATQLLELAQDTAERITGGEAGLTGTLRLGASPTIGNYILPDILGSFQSKHPGASVVVAIDPTPRIVERVLQHEVVLGVIEGLSDHRDLVVTRFKRDEMVVICHPEHPWASMTRVPRNEVAEQPFILRESGSATRTIIMRAAAEAEISLNVVCQYGQTEAIKTAVEARHGVSVLSRVACAREIAAGLLAETRIEGVAFDRWFYLVKHRERRSSTRLQAFLDHLMEKSFD